MKVNLLIYRLVTSLVRAYRKLERILIDALRTGSIPLITATDITIHVLLRDYHYPKAASPGVSGYSSPPLTFANGLTVPVHPGGISRDINFESELSVSATEISRNPRRSFHLFQLQRSSLHLEKCLVKQKIEEHEISLQALKERLVELEKKIGSTTPAANHLRCYMDRIGVPIPDMPDHVAAATMLSEVTVLTSFSRCMS
ncbi:hypothetical protein EDB83DRAFT_2352896 [Lactarius deliciosus]|nr:hypothetical protein EDB83DRAFT_2352896 [Lactarius deliciosus]